MSETVTAIVPMRHDSERVPGKNYRPFCGAPLYHRVLETLLSVPTISCVVIDTDSPLIKSDTAVSFPEVHILERPEWLRSGHVSMNEILQHTVGQLSGELFLQSHSTSPLLKAETISRAIELFLASRPAYDSLFSVTRLQTRLYDAAGSPMNHDPNTLLRTQDLPPVYEENSGFYLFSKQMLEKRGNRIGSNPLLFEIDAIEAWDIDEEFDFTAAEVFFARRNRGGI